MVHVMWFGAGGLVRCNVVDFAQKSEKVLVSNQEA
jgi:hypothetical protein